MMNIMITLDFEMLEILSLKRLRGTRSNSMQKKALKELESRYTVNMNPQLGADIFFFLFIILSWYYDLNKIRMMV